MKSFTLIEVLITITVFALVGAGIYSSHILSQKAYKEGEVSAEITQNGRVIMERMTREIRQAKELVGDFPEEEADAVSEIAFEDGHISQPYHYIHYFLSGSTVQREVLGYYFSGDVGQTLVPWNSVPPLGQSLLSKNLEEARVIGEWVKELKIWGARLITINLSLEKKQKAFFLETKILSRNF
jgi:prepilin-type N-terminal cleavage/methylation domain-containing protein